MTYSGGIPSGSKNANDPLATGSFSSDPGQAVFPANVFPPATASNDYSLYSSRGPTIVSNIFAHYNMTKTVDQLPFGMDGGVNIIRERASGSAYAQFLNDKEQTLTMADSWLPTSVASLSFWLDAADSSTITLNGSTVSQWDDKSANGRNFVQTTPSNQPTLISSGGNLVSQHISFSNNDFMTVGSNFPYSTAQGSGEQWTAAAVFTLDTNPGTNNTILSRIFNPAVHQVSLQNNSSAVTEIQLGYQSVAGFSPPRSISTSAKNLLVVKISGTDVVFRLNGVEFTTTRADNTHGLTNQAYNIMYAFNNAVISAGEICHFNQALISNDITSLESYLSKKWSITI